MTFTFEDADEVPESLESISDEIVNEVNGLDEQHDKLRATIIDYIKLSTSGNSAAILASIALEASIMSRAHSTQLLHSIFISQIQWLDGLVLGGIIVTMDFLKARTDMWMRLARTESFIGQRVAEADKSLQGIHNYEALQHYNKIFKIHRKINRKYIASRSFPDMSFEFARCVESFWAVFESIELGIAVLSLILFISGLWSLIFHLSLQ